MRVLLAGNVGYVTSGWIQQALQDCRVLLAGQTSLKSDPANHLSVVDEASVDFSHLFEAYGFDLVILFSNRLTFHTQETGELERLQTILECCKRHACPRLLYIDGPASLAERPDAVSMAAEQLCMQMADSHLLVQVLHSLHLYSAVFEHDYFYHLFTELERRGHFHFHHAMHQPLSFLAMDDLAELVSKMLDQPEAESAVFHVPDCFAHTFAHLENRLRALQPKCHFSYDDHCRPLPSPKDDLILRRQYNWFPKYSLLEDLPEMLQAYRSVSHTPGKFCRRLMDWSQQHRGLFIALEVLAAAGLAAACGWLSRWQYQFGLIDFRLLFIVLMATMHGMGAGVASAAIASVMLVGAHHLQGGNWLTLFYDPSNWIVFIAYFIVGTSCGYVRLITLDQLRFAREENEQLKEKLLFAKKMYNDVLGDKRAYKKQIVSTKDSFGKIFQITQQLNVTHDKEVFIQAIEILEQVMENQSISLYSVQPGQRYARLIAASRQMNETLSASIRLEQYEQALSVVQEEGVFANTELLEGYPAYMAGLKQNGDVRMLVIIHHAEYEQLSLYHKNLFKILCGLISSALTHTMEYQELLRAEQCIPGTGILKEAYFEKKLELDRAMDERKLATHLLLRVDCAGRSLEEMDALLSSRLRASDTVGVRKDGQLYVILAQATPASLPLITGRLAETGIASEAISA